MRLLRYFSALALLAGVMGTNAIADGGKSVVVINNTSYTLNELYASASDNSDWDTTNNLLAGQILRPGQEATVSIADSSAACSYDLMGVLYGSAQYAYQYQVNACSGYSWTITP
jgi:hypothetical protein